MSASTQSPKHSGHNHQTHSAHTHKIQHCPAAPKGGKSDLLRLFIALELPRSYGRSLSEALRRTRKLRERGTIVKEENLHITVKFIGEVPLAKAKEIQTMLAALTPELEALLADCRLSWPGYGSFKTGEGLTFYARIEGNDAVNALVRLIDEKLGELGIPREQRPFKAHVTLARRLSWPDAAPDLKTWPCLPAPQHPGALTLFLSEFTPNGMKYSPVWSLKD